MSLDRRLHRISLRGGVAALFMSLAVAQAAHSTPVGPVLAPTAASQTVDAIRTNIDLALAKKRHTQARAEETAVDSSR